MSITNQDPTSVVIMRVKQCTDINELKVLRRQYDGNGTRQRQKMGLFSDPCMDPIINIIMGSPLVFDN